MEYRKPLGKKSLEYDANRLRALMPSGGGAATNYPTFVPAIATDLGVVYSPTAGVTMADGANVVVGGSIFQVPAGWSGTLTASAIIEVGNSTSGNLYCRIGYQRAAVDGLITAIGGTLATVAIAADSNGKLLSVKATVITSAAASELVDLKFNRNASHGSDTYGADIYCRGFLLDWG